MHNLISLIPQTPVSIHFLVAVGHYESRHSMENPPLKNYAIQSRRTAACCHVCNFKGTEKDLNETEVFVDGLRQDFGFYFLLLAHIASIVSKTQHNKESFHLNNANDLVYAAAPHL